MDARRTARKPIVLPIMLSGTDFNGQAFKENTWTIGVNRHGAKISTTYRLAAGDQVMVGDPGLGRSTKARVAWVAEKGRAFEVGIELSEPQEIWEARISPENGPARNASGEPDAGSTTPAPSAQPAQRLVSTLLPKPGADGDSSGMAVAAMASLDPPRPPAARTALDGPSAQMAPETRSESLANFLRDSRAELDGLLAKSHEIQRLSSQAVQSLLEAVHSKLHEELEAAAAGFARDTQQRFDQLGAAALETFHKQVRSHQASLLDETLALANKAHLEIDRSFHAGVADYRIKLAECSSSALQEFRDEGKAFFGSSRLDFQKALDESRKKADDDLSGHVLKVTDDLANELRRRAEVGFEILNEQLARSATTLVEETQTHVATLSQSALADLSRKASETLQQHVNLNIGALNDATAQARVSLDTYFQQSIEVFQKQISELSKKAVERNSKASEVVLHGLQSRLDQAARALLGGVGSTAVEEERSGD